MAAQTFGSTSTTTAAPPRVNLLPPEIAERVQVRKSQLAMVATGLAALAVVGGLYMQASAKVSDANDQKTEALAANAKLRSDVAKLETVKQTYAQVDAANKTLAAAMANEIRWSTYLNDLTFTIPENVWLSRMEVKLNGPKSSGANSTEVFSGGLGTARFEGSAFHHDDVASWLESLAGQKGYTDPYFTKSEQRGGGEVVDFDSTTYLGEKALSNRYAKGIKR